MGYTATGRGYIQFIPGNEELIKELLENSPFDWDWDNDDGGLSIWQCEKYYDDKYNEVLAKLTPFVKFGELEFVGEDGSMWRFVFRDDKFVEESGEPLYEFEKEAIDRGINALKKLLDNMSQHYECAVVLAAAREAGLSDDDLKKLGVEFLLDVEKGG